LCFYGLSAAAAADADPGADAPTLAKRRALSTHWKTRKALDADQSPRRPGENWGVPPGTIRSAASAKTDPEKTGRFTAHFGLEAALQARDQAKAESGGA